ncbi:MAG TPA: aa3-type cytochrome c oxidase subunit IV [Sphingomonas sp.]|nr:aa3-type cytochrome c oxidase subunit IV [Sphingomonas sp.]
MAGNGDMQAHEATYANIMALLKWGAVGCFLIAFLVIFLIS